MPIAEFKQILTLLLRENKQNKIFEELLRVNNEEVRNQTVILASRQNALKKNISLGVINQEDIETEQSQINVALLSTINEIDEGDTLSKKADRRLLEKLELRKARLELLNTILGLLTSLIALSLAIYGINKSTANSEGINDTKEKIEQLEKGFRIIEPTSEAELKGDSKVKFTMLGKSREKIPEDKSLMLFAKQGNFYYYMIDDIVLDANSEWRHGNILLGIEGDFRLILYLMDKFEADIIKKQAPSGTSFKLEHKPKAAKELTSVFVNRVLITN